MKSLKTTWLLFIALSMFIHGTGFSQMALTTKEEIKYPNMMEEKPPAKIFIDPKGTMKCSEIQDQDFSDIEFPYRPGFFEGILWFTIQIDKKKLDERQRYMVLFENQNIDFAEAFIKSGENWILIGRTGKAIRTREMSLASILSAIPLMENLDGTEEAKNIRIRFASTNGDPVTIKILSTTRYLKKVNRVLSNFSFSGGIGICIFFGLLLTSILLRDPAYLFLALSALLYILRALHIKGSGPVFVWNFLASLPQSRKIEYVLDGLEVVILSICGRFFISKKTSEPFLTKQMGILFEIVIIEMLMIFTVNSQTTLYLLYLILSTVQRVFLIAGHSKHIGKKDFDMHVIFVPWIIAFSFSIIFRILIGMRNFLCMDISDSIKLNEYITSTIWFLMLTIPPLYLIGKRFNIRYQFVQSEYQQLETRFIEEEKKKQIISSATKKITKSTSTVLNSAGILSKLNFSAANAEYIELIKTESARINDLLVSISVLEGQSQPLGSKILFLDFFNSCMISVNQIVSAKKVSISLTTAVANDTVISADPRILQNIIISFSCSTIRISNSSRISIYLEEKGGSFTLTITSQLQNEFHGNTEKINARLNEDTYFDFICEVAKIYGGTVTIHPLDDKCRFVLQLNFETAGNTNQSSVVVNKTNFEISENSARLLKNKNKSGLEIADQPLEKVQEIQIETDEDKSRSSDDALQMDSIPLMMEKKIEDPFEKFNFSTREKEIATLIAEGKSDKEIASQLNISPQTVATHNKKIFRKAEVHSRVELINKLR